jgi:carbon-monoxide dehydrogenase small subunit
MSELLDVTLLINGKTTRFGLSRAAPFIRDECGQTGTNMGCEHRVCDACTILVDGDPVRACLMFAVQEQASAIRTVEGLAQGNNCTRCNLP